ncbi:putative protein OS=Streptomyces lavendulae subsp. lavendulae OX=58340 GN=SLAV_04960 PE=4 SV=1 [Streptomyces lavendulae subsp. lavendulae]
MGMPTWAGAGPGRWACVSRCEGNYGSGLEPPSTDTGQHGAAGTGPRNGSRPGRRGRPRHGFRRPGPEGRAAPARRRRVPGPEPDGPRPGRRRRRDRAPDAGAAVLQGPSARTAPRLQRPTTGRRRPRAARRRKPRRRRGGGGDRRGPRGAGPRAPRRVRRMPTAGPDGPGVRGNGMTRFLRAAGTPAGYGRGRRRIAGTGRGVDGGADRGRPDTGRPGTGPTGYGADRGTGLGRGAARGDARAAPPRVRLPGRAAVAARVAVRKAAVSTPAGPAEPPYGPGRIRPRRTGRTRADHGGPRGRTG